MLAAAWMRGRPHHAPISEADPKAIIPRSKFGFPKIKTCRSGQRSKKPVSLPKLECLK